VPPAAFVSNNFVRKFANGEPYNIIAGQKRGTISGGNIVGVEYDFTDTDRGWLEPFGLNPIIKKRGFGVVIFGNQTAYQTVNSAFGLVHVRDLLISVENDVEEILANYLFDFNEDSIRLEIKTLVDTYLDGVRAGGGIYAYQVIMDASNNTPAIIDQNIGIIDVIIEPARGIQKFINRITVTRTGGIAAGGFINFV
jgi:phage tail sheath protein FI